MPPPPSIPGARTRRAECIVKEAANAPISEKSISTESSSTESSSTESSSDEVEDDIENPGSADNGNAENASEIEDNSAVNKASEAEDASNGDKASDIEDANDAEDASNAENAKTDKALNDSNHSPTAEFSMDTEDAKGTENTKTFDSQPQKIDNVPKTPQPPVPVQDDEVLVLLTPLKRPVPDNSDVDMGSPPAPALQGASRMTGGIFRGKAYGNIANHADFPDLAVDAVPTLSFKILAHVEYGDAFSVNLAPDFVVQLPICVFFLTGTSLLAQLILKKMAQLHDKITSKIYYAYTLTY